MSSEQLGQLYELMHATKDVWKSASELESDVEAEAESRIREQSSDTDGESRSR